MKARLVSALLMSLVILVGTACGPAATPVATPTAPAVAPVATPTSPPTVPPPAEVTLKIIDDTEAHGVALQKLAPIYEEKTGVKVEVEIFPYEATYEKEMLMFSTGGSDYDIVVHDCIWTTQYQKNGWLLDMKPFMDDPSLPDIDLAGFVPGLPETYGVRGDHVYSIHIDLALQVMAYRKDLFQEAGIPGPPKTWDEFFDYAKRMTKEPDVYGWQYMAGEPDSCYSDWAARLQGFKLPEGQVEFILNADASKTVFAEHDYGYKALELQMQALPYAPPGALGYGYGEGISAFCEGLSGMFISWSVNFAEFEDPDKCVVAGNVGYAPPPFSEEQNYYVGGWEMGINALSENPDEAYKFIAWIASDEGQEAMLEAGSATPYRQKPYSDPKWVSQWPVLEAIKEQQAGHPIPLPLTPHFVEMQQPLFEQLQMVLAGEKSVEEGLRQAAQEIDAILGQ